MALIKLEIPGVPLAWKAPYVGTKGCFSVRTPIIHQHRDLLRGQYEGPLISQSVRVDLCFFMPIPKTATKKMRESMSNGRIRPFKRPDRGNLLKLAEDILTGVVLADDSFIVEGDVEKWYGEPPRTEITIEILEEKS